MLAGDGSAGALSDAFGSSRVFSERLGSSLRAFRSSRRALGGSWRLSGTLRSSRDLSGPLGIYRELFGVVEDFRKLSGALGGSRELPRLSEAVGIMRKVGNAMNREFRS